MLGVFVAAGWQVKDMQDVLVEVAQGVGESGGADAPAARDGVLGLSPSAAAAAISAEQRAADRWRRENSRLAAELALARTQLAEVSSSNASSHSLPASEPSSEML